MPVSPSTDNLWIGKGIVTFQATGETTARDVGEVSELEFTPEIERLDKFGNRAGVRNKIKSVILSRSGTVRMVMDEITAENFALAVAGTITTNTAGDNVVAILANNATEGVLRITGTNEVGQQLDAEFLNVSFAPNGSVGFISDEFGAIEVTGEVLADSNGDFGTVTFREQA